MTHPTDRTAPDQTVDDLISEAYAATGILPTIDRCRELNTALREHIRQLDGQVRQRQDKASQRSRDWYRCDRLAADTRELLAHDMGSGLMSAALHVAQLGRHCQMLRDCIRDT